MTDCDSQPRIPPSLQAVFLASNRGHLVDTPPPGKAAFKVFFRKWFVQRRGSGFAKTSSKTMRRLSTQSCTEFTASSSHYCTVEDTSIEMKVATEGSKLPVLSPQAYLDAMIRSQGYSTRRYMTMQSAYRNTPTPLQKASYGTLIVNVVRKSDTKQMMALLSAGLSRNPCNGFGESIIHMVCRRGDSEMLQLLLNQGCSVQVADDYGRTPLHDACWAVKPAFEVVDLLLQQDPNLLHMQDFRGFVPLLYIRQEHRSEWIEYLESRKELYWPRQDGSQSLEPPPLTLQGPNTRPIPDPKGALTVQLAEMLASGRMDVDEISLIRYDNKDSAQADDCSDDGYNDDNSDSESVCSDNTFDEKEMADILQSLGALRVTASGSVRVNC